MRPLAAISASAAATSPVLGNVTAAGCDRLVALALVKQEKESLVLHDGSANVDVKLVVIDERSTTLAGRGAIIGVVVREVIIGVSKTTVINPGAAAVPVLVPLFMLMRIGAPPLTPYSDEKAFPARSTLQSRPGGRPCQNPQDAGLVDG